MRLARFVAFCFMSVMSVSSSGVKESATKQHYNSEELGHQLLGVGVRKKGPFSVYAVGAYSTPTCNRLVDLTKKKILSILGNDSVQDETVFLLKMNMKVSSGKISKAISDSVGQRLKNNSDPNSLSSLSNMISTGLKSNHAVKGSSLLFHCKEGDVEITVNNKVIGCVPGIGAAFHQVYLDENSVSPKLKENIVESFASSSE